MASEHLLPPNATALERALSFATDLLPRLGGEPGRIAGFKFAPADPLLPWLIWEYGLEELLPYLPDPRRAIAEGVPWQRLRGTPAALTLALSWIGATATVEQETPGIHFAEFQFDPGLVLESDEAIASLIAVARLSAPARSRLSRIYHGWDLRRLVLDESLLGEALLSDHSGVLWSDGTTKLSFGRVRKFAHPPPETILVSAHESVRFVAARLIDRYLLSFSALGDPGHTPNEEIIHSHLFTLANGLGIPDPLGLRPERRFCKAMVVLSDSTPLGDINACTPRFDWRESGTPLGLGEGVLSESDHRLRRVEVLERLYTHYPAAVTVPTPTWGAGHESVAFHPVQARADTLLGLLRTGDERPVRDAWQMVRLYSPSQEPLPDPVPLRARLFQRAQVVLSDSRPLGDENSRTPRRALHRTRPVPRLGDWALGEVAEVEWRSLPEMHLRLSGIDEADPYDLLDPTPSQWRLSSGAATTATTLGQLCLGDPGAPTVAAPSREAVATTRATWQGQTWTGVRWPTSTWQETRELIGTSHMST